LGSSRGGESGEELISARTATKIDEQVHLALHVGDPDIYAEAALHVRLDLLLRDDLGVRTNHSAAGDVRHDVDACQTEKPVHRHMQHIDDSGDLLKTVTHRVCVEVIGEKNACLDTRSEGTNPVYNEGVEGDNAGKLMRVQLIEELGDSSSERLGVADVEALELHEDLGVVLLCKEEDIAQQGHRLRGIRVILVSQLLELLQGHIRNPALGGSAISVNQQAVDGVIVENDNVTICGETAIKLEGRGTILNSKLERRQGVFGDIREPAATTMSHDHALQTRSYKTFVIKQSSRTRVFCTT